MRLSTLTFNEFLFFLRFAWETVFLVGKSQDDRINNLMLMESKQHNDVIIGDFLDTYRNLTYKTLLTIEYPNKHCPNAQYIMKTDEDCYINVKSVIQWLVSQQKSTTVKPLYMGRIHWDNTPSRGNTSKYYVTREEYKEDVYPPYAAGGGYVFTGSLLPQLLQASKITAVFPMEDAYFGILMQKIGVNATNQSLVLPYTFCDCEVDNHCQVWYDDSLCNIAVAMVIHDVRPDELIRTHINIMMVNSVPSICKHEENRESWDSKSCDFSGKQKNLWIKIFLPVNRKIATANQRDANKLYHVSICKHCKIYLIHKISFFNPLCFVCLSVCLFVVVVVVVFFFFFFLKITIRVDVLLTIIKIGFEFKICEIAVWFCSLQDYIAKN